MERKYSTYGHRLLAFLGDLMLKVRGDALAVNQETVRVESEAWNDRGNTQLQDVKRE